MYDDTMRYMEEAYHACGESFDPQARERLCKAVLAPFGSVRGYHGCRPLSFETYRRNGLQVLTRQRLARIAFELFDGSIPLDSLERRAELADIETRLGNAYFCASSEDLIQECGHYLIYGAEALNTLWKTSDSNDVFRFHESQQRARVRGIPTIVVCDVPLPRILANYRESLVNTMVTWHLQLASEKPVEPHEEERNWAFAIDQDLPAAFIRDHIHPPRIRDPLNYSSTFKNPHTECDGCIAVASSRKAVRHQPNRPRPQKPTF